MAIILTRHLLLRPGVEGPTLRGPGQEGWGDAVEIGRQVSSLAAGDRVLVAGDALINTDDRPALPDPDVASGHQEALRPVELLGDLDVETAYAGHGEPVLCGACEQVRALG